MGVPRQRYNADAEPILLQHVLGCRETEHYEFVLGAVHTGLQQTAHMGVSERLLPASSRGYGVHTQKQVNFRSVLWKIVKWFIYLILDGARVAKVLDRLITLVQFFK